MQTFMLYIAPLKISMLSYTGILKMLASFIKTALLFDKQARHKLHWYFNNGTYGSD